jgi:hypothetical protein
MRKSRFAQEQIIAILAEQERGMAVRLQQCQTAFGPQRPSPSYRPPLARAHGAAPLTAGFHQANKCNINQRALLMNEGVKGRRSNCQKFTDLDQLRQINGGS